ncbi:MAG: hypothetical protein JWM95_4748, partial [Gemmatimonadetes bacterium]|nr:hypothetical protein [Gemmatimonadota bacterium]
EKESEAMKSRIAQLEQPAALPASTLVPPREQIFDKQVFQNLALGVFLLMLPMSIALARRIWLRTPRKQPMLDIESSPRMQRMEEAIEAIAIEVERVGEAQRFATKLLSERRPDAAASRVAVPQRAPGTITPH